MIIISLDFCDGILSVFNEKSSNFHLKYTRKYKQCYIQTSTNTLVSCIIVKTLHFQRKSMYNFEELNIVNKFYFKLQFFHSQKDTLFPQVADKDFFAYVRSALYLLCVISTPLQCANTLGAFISKASLVTWHNGTSLKTKWSAHLMNPETEKTRRHLQ